MKYTECWIVMNYHNAIGGYFELALPGDRRKSSPYEEEIALNSARNSFEYILRVRKPKKVYMPKFTCDVMLEPLQKTNTEYVFYSIDQKFEIVDDITVESDELIVYTNYFGVKDTYSTLLSRKYDDRLLLDCSQAFFYTQQKNEHVIYSPRKFVGVADGGYVVTDRYLPDELPVDTSHERMGHLLKRLELGPEDGYEDFQRNDASLEGQPIKKMSKITESILDYVDYNAIRTVRNNNFEYLHNHLADKNEIVIENGTFNTPLVYPFMTKDAPSLRRKLIENKIFTAMYWPNVLEWCDESEIEHTLTRDILALPIDQRYGVNEMNRILEVIYGN